MVDSICTIISAVFSLIGIFASIIINGFHQISFSFGWIAFWSIALLSSITLLIAISKLKSRNLTRENIGISYLKDNNIPSIKPKQEILVEPRFISPKVVNNTRIQVKNYCRYCGNMLRTHYNFCPYCGNHI